MAENKCETVYVFDETESGAKWQIEMMEKDGYQVVDWGPDGEQDGQLRFWVKRRYVEKTPSGHSVRTASRRKVAGRQSASGISHTNRGMGWIRDLPDLRDYRVDTSRIRNLLNESAMLKAWLDEHEVEINADKVPKSRKVSKKKVAKSAAKSVVKIPSAVDLSEHCSPVEEQGNLGSCSAHAGVGLMEYFQRKSFSRHIDASRRFLYKVTRKLLDWNGDTGAYLRTTMKALVLFGTPPEEYWPYDEDEFDVEPSHFCYAMAQSYRASYYYRLDSPGMPFDKVLDTVKTFLAAGLPSMFGFSVYDSIEKAKGGEILFPSYSDKLVGGHAVVAVGYDNAKQIGNCAAGALKIRNSWGRDWGAVGYGWLPYEYVLQGLTDDFWSLIDAGFVDADLFR